MKKRKVKKTKTGCRDIIRKIRLVLDGESSTKSEKSLYKHLGECNCCLKEYHIEKEFRYLLRARIRHLPVSRSLINSIRKKISVSDK